MSGQGQEHWSRIYTDKAPSIVSWYQSEPQVSLGILERSGVDPSSSLIDVGGGASNLVDRLLDRAWKEVTVLDIAAPALEASRARLGPRSRGVTWIVADVSRWEPARQYDVWHDRAVFHFLMDPADRAAYLAAMRTGLTGKGLVIMGTFDLSGPAKCSGLPVQRYDAASLAAEFGRDFRLIDTLEDEHITPAGQSQLFRWCVFRRIQSGPAQTGAVLDPARF